MIIRFFCAVIIFLVGVVAAQAQQCTRSSAPYTKVSGVVVDQTNKLAWQRCSYGQVWNGQTCTGTATGLWFNQAVALTPPAGSDGFAWRVPGPDELKSLVLAEQGCSPSIDQQAFPNTVASYYWTNQPLNAPGIDNAYCRYFGAFPSGFDNCYALNGFYVRFVSTLPPGYTGPTAPSGIWFNVDSSGNYLLVGGSNFASSPADNVVTFVGDGGPINGVPIEATTYSLKVAIPAAATTGAITVTSNSMTSAPSSAILRVINNNAGCKAAGLFSATAPGGGWQYCFFMSSSASPFSDKAGDVLVIGANTAKLPSGQNYYTVSTSDLVKSQGKSITLNGQIALQYDATNNVYGLLAVNNTSRGVGPDSFTTNSRFYNNGYIQNRGSFINNGIMQSLGNGVIANTGTFTNKLSPGGGFSIGTTGTAISSTISDQPGSFVNASERSTGPRGTLNNLGRMGTLDVAIPGIVNIGGDVINAGTLVLQSLNAIVNKSGALQSSVVTNNGTLTVAINPLSPNNVVVNEAGATIKNNAGATLTNSQVTVGILNNGTIVNCGTTSGRVPTPNGYTACP